MKNLVFLQILVYLFLSPLILIFLKDEERMIGLSFVFLIGVLVGFFFQKVKFRPYAKGFEVQPPKFSFLFAFFWILITFIYVFIVIDQGLIYRRLGSEVVAEIASNMPIQFKIIMRTYEVSFYPLLFVFLSGISRNKMSFYEFFILVSFFVGFIFTGVLDSRMKMIFPILFYYVFFIFADPSHKPIPKKSFYIIGSFFIFSALLISLTRISYFDDFSEYILNDIIIRLDGLQLISRVDDYINIPPYGTLDVMMWQNIVAMIPFLEVAKYLKELGLTSTKSYFLQVVLGTKQYDSNDSVVTDLFYFGGYFLTFFGAVLFGYFVMKVDLMLKYSMVWKSRAVLAFVLSFFMNGWLLENGYTSIFFSTLRDFFILYILFLGLKFFKPKNNFIQERV